MGDRQETTVSLSGRSFEQRQLAEQALSLPFEVVFDHLQLVRGQEVRVPLQVTKGHLDDLELSLELFCFRHALDVLHAMGTWKLWTDRKCHPRRPRVTPCALSATPSTVKSRTQLDAIISKFASDLEAAIRAEVREQLLSAIESGVASPRSERSTPKTIGKAKPAQAGKRVRRSAEALTEVQGAITKLLGQGSKLTSQEIQEQLGLAKEAIQRPLALLRDAGTVKTVGEKRNMRYFAGAGRAGVVKRAKTDAAE